MMISPECYYSLYLQGKDREELLREIRSLKRQIAKQKRELGMEYAGPGTGPGMYPTPLTRIQCARESLEKAKQAYREAGGCYVPTAAEKRDAKFNRDLQHITRFSFARGGLFGGEQVRTYTLSEGKVLPDAPACALFTREEFIEGIADLHLGEWKRKYIGPGVQDGTQWVLDIVYDDGRRPVRFEGSNAFPYNFDALLAFLGIDDPENGEGGA